MLQELAALQPAAPEPEALAHLAGSCLCLQVPAACTAPARVGPHACAPPSRVRLLGRFNGALAFDIDLAGVTSREVRSLHV